MQSFVQHTVKLLNFALEINEGPVNVEQKPRLAGVETVVMETGYGEQVTLQSHWTPKYERTFVGEKARPFSGWYGSKYGLDCVVHFGPVSGVVVHWNFQTGILKENCAVNLKVIRLVS